MFEFSCLFYEAFHHRPNAFKSFIIINHFQYVDDFNIAE